MKLAITGRQVEVTPALRKYTEGKLKKLEKLLGAPVDAHAVLVIEKHRHRAEIQVRSRSAVLSGDGETEDLYATIGIVAEKLERQALRHKEKNHGRKKRAGRKEPGVAERRPAAESRAESEERRSPRIVRSERHRLKPFSPEDAALELEATGEDILVYRDASTYRVNVVYRRGDGSFGLVDPEF